MKKLIFFIGLCYGIYWFFGSNAVTPIPVLSNEKGISRALKDPFQKDMPSGKGIKFEDGRLNFLAQYDITARVLKKKYYNDGKNAQIAPLDLALGWRRMSDPAVYGKLNITQSGRFYYYRWPDFPPIPSQEIVTSSANTHIIAANDNVEKQLSTVKEGHVVNLRGYLVHYREDHPDGSWWQWRSSMTRGDSGAGACEVFYVQSIAVY